MLPLLRNSADASVVVHDEQRRSPRPRVLGRLLRSPKPAPNASPRFSARSSRAPPIRINVINPGRTRTRMRTRAYPGENPASVPPPEHAVPAYLYLLGGASRGVRGQRFELTEPTSRLGRAFGRVPGRDVRRRRTRGSRRFIRRAVDRREIFAPEVVGVMDLDERRVLERAARPCDIEHVDVHGQRAVPLRRASARRVAASRASRRSCRWVLRTSQPCCGEHGADRAACDDRGMLGAHLGVDGLTGAC